MLYGRKCWVSEVHINTMYVADMQVLEFTYSIMIMDKLRKESLIAHTGDKIRKV